MKDLAPDDRPREKLLQHGAGALGDNELLALIVGSGTHRLDALAVANALLQQGGGLHGLTRISADALAMVGGIGRARAARVLAAVELGRRTLRRGPGPRTQLRTPQEAAAYLLPGHGAHPVEQFGLVLLDTRHRVLRTRIVASGTLNTTIVHPRDVFREAVLGSAAAVVVFHNHPSGDPTPSQDDIELTRRLRAAGVLMGIEVVDHVILADARYCSLKEMGQI
ncbi:MAG: DNA repair protein RadC [Vicinamibacterales bacterium]